MKKQNTVIALGIVSGIILLASNLLATKIFSFFGVPADCGLILYPVSYVVSDLILMISGDNTRQPRLIIWTSFAMNAVVTVLLAIAIRLPAYPSWGNQDAFAAIFGFTPRVVIGSLLAYVISNLINILFFRKIIASNFLKSYGSSAISKIFDIAIFETIAFLGILPIRDFIVQAIFAYGLGLLLEFPLSLLACWIYRVSFSDKPTQ